MLLTNIDDIILYFLLPHSSDVKQHFSFALLGTTEPTSLGKTKYRFRIMTKILVTLFDDVKIGYNVLSWCLIYEIDVPRCTNTDNGALDNTDDSCIGWYNDNPEDCGEYDDDDFSAKDMCCACKTSGINILNN